MKNKFTTSTTLIPKKLSPQKQSKNSSSMIKIFLFTKHFHTMCQASSPWNHVQSPSMIEKIVWILFRFRGLDQWRGGLCCISTLNFKKRWVPPWNINPLLPLLWLLPQWFPHVPTTFNTSYSYCIAIRTMYFELNYLHLGYQLCRISCFVVVILVMKCPSQTFQAFINK